MSHLAGVQVHSFVRAQVAQEPDAQKQLGILLGALIRSAAQVQAEGLAKKAAVRNALKEALFTAVMDPDEMKDWLQRVTPWGGARGWAVDKLIEIAPIEGLIDGLLDGLIETTYQAMRRNGLT